jgi:hypothetical protein
MFLHGRFPATSRIADIPLFVDILKRARRVFEQKGAQFVVLFWDDTALVKAVTRVLKAEHF